MARSGKTGLDYFTHDVDMRNDPKIKYLIAEHGLIGYAIFNLLLESIYREGYYISYTERDNILFSNDNNIDRNVSILILNVCINEGLFDKELYDKYQILTSKRIQVNYINGTCRRKEINFTKEYLLINPSEYLPENIKDKINVNIKELNVNILPINVNIENSEFLSEDIKNIKKLNVNNLPINVNNKELNVDNNPLNDNKSTQIEIEIEIEKESKSSSPKFKISEDAIKFSNWFKTLLPDSHKITESDLKNWGKTYDDLIRIDKRTKEEICQVVKWARNDDFWNKNFFSAMKLRQKDKSGTMYYDILLNKSKGKTNGRAATTDKDKERIITGIYGNN